MLRKNHMLFTVFKQTATGAATNHPPTPIKLGAAALKSNSNFYIMREKHLIEPRPGHKFEPAHTPGTYHAQGLAEQVQIELQYARAGNFLSSQHPTSASGRQLEAVPY